MPQGILKYYDYMSKGEVQKGYHYAWQIHYRLVFPVKYRKALLDKMVIKIIEETAEGIQERYAIEMEALGMVRTIFIFSPAPIRRYHLGE